MEAFKVLTAIRSRLPALLGGELGMPHWLPASFPYYFNEGSERFICASVVSGLLSLPFLYAARLLRATFRSPSLPDTTRTHFPIMGAWTPR
jgi:hypothetical protein